MKKVLLLFNLSIFIYCNLNAQLPEKKPHSEISDTLNKRSLKITVPYGDDTNYSKKSIFLYPPQPNDWVRDYEEIFSSSELEELNNILKKFEEETTNEIVIITIDSSWIAKHNFDSLTLVLAKKWAVGKKGKNNGILFGICTGHKILRIQNGYGIEAKLSNINTKKIIDESILPDFKLEQYFEGTKKRNHGHYSKDSLNLLT